MARRSFKVIAFTTITVLAISLNVVARWFPSLRLIVWAFFAGAAASLVLFLALVLLTVHRGERGGPYSSHDVLRSIRPLAFTALESWSKEVEAIALEDSFHRVPLHPPSFVLSDSLDVLLDCVLRDFVNSWYSKISQDPSFTIQVDRTVRHALERLRERIQSLDLAEVIVGKIVPLLTSHLHDFSAAEHIVRGKYLNKNLTESEELDLAIASKYRDGKLHPAASLKFSDTKLAQQDHLRKVVESILPSILPEKEKKSRAVGIIVKEIMACVILFPVMGMLSDPDFWNQFIEAIGRSTLQDRKTVRKLRAALDQHATPRQSNSSHRSKYNPQASTAYNQPFIRLSPKDDERTFERFIRSIRMCANLSDARRLRNEISAQLKRDARIGGGEGWNVYVKRLETGKKVADQKVTSLSAGQTTLGAGPLRLQSEILLGGQTVPSLLEFASLDHVLRDSPGLSYFMEHMDRQKRLALVQFWLVVDGLRNPLEEDISSSDDEQESSSSTTLPAWTASDRNDLAQIHDAYLSIPQLEISGKSRNAVKGFLKAGSKATQVQYAKARAAILRAQSTVFEEMQKKDFNEFKESDLFYKYLASDETAAAAQGRPSTKVSSTDMHRSSSWTESLRVHDMSEDLLSSIHSSDGNRPLESTLEGWDFDPLSASRQSIEDELGSRDQLYPPPSQASIERRRQTPESGIVEAMEAALNDIIEERPSSLDESRGSLFQNSPELVLTTPNSPRSSIDIPRDTNNSNGNGNGQKSIPAIVKEKAKTKAPSISSLGLINSNTKDAVFADELFPDEDATADYASSGGENDDNEGLYEINGSEEEIHQAAPGDLGLAEAISTLTFDIEKLSTQEAVIDSLYRKAELTNNTVELRILRKSKSSLQREIRRKELQRQQYIVQESDNGLFGRSTIRIKSTVVGNENGQDYALYIIEVQRKGGEQMPAAQWAVARRYSEFFQLHQQLRGRFDPVKQLEFPRRRVVMKLQKDFLEKRRITLDKYLKALLLIPDVCRSRELRAFLSQQSITPQSNIAQYNPDDDRRDIISRLYNSIADGMDDVLGNIPILDQLTLTSANMATTTASQMQSHQKSDLGGQMLDAAEAEAELSAFEDKEVEPFVKPICDLFLEVFELNRGSNWLRGRAVVVVLHQLLGGTIERKAREQAKSFLDEESILKYIRLLKDTMWPDGNLRQGTKIRTPKEKSKTRTEASLMLATLLPDVAASVVGRANAQVAGRRLFAAFNNQRLNTSIIYSIIDEIVAIIFEDAR